MVHRYKLTSALLAVSSVSIVSATGAQHSVSTVLPKLNKALGTYVVTASAFNTSKSGAYTFGDSRRAWGVAGYLTKPGSSEVDGINFDGSAPMNMIVLPPVFDVTASFLNTWCDWKNEDDIVFLLISKHFTSVRLNTDPHTLLPTEMPQIHVTHVGICTVASTVTDFGSALFQPSFYVWNVGGTAVAPPGAARPPAPTAKSAVKASIVQPVVVKPLTKPAVAPPPSAARPVVTPQTPVPPASTERFDPRVPLVHDFKVQGKITATAASPDGALLAIGQDNGTLGLLDVQARRLKFSAAVQPRNAFAYPGVGSVVFPEQGNAVLVVTINGPVRMFDVTAHRLRARTDGAAADAPTTHRCRTTVPRPPRPLRRDLPAIRSTDLRWLLAIPTDRRLPIPSQRDSNDETAMTEGCLCSPGWFAVHGKLRVTSGSLPRLA